MSVLRERSERIPPRPCGEGNALHFHNYQFKPIIKTHIFKQEYFKVESVFFYPSTWDSITLIILFVVVVIDLWWAEQEEDQDQDQGGGEEEDHFRQEEEVQEEEVQEEDEVQEEEEARRRVE